MFARSLARQAPSWCVGLSPAAWRQAATQQCSASTSRSLHATSARVAQSVTTSSTKELRSPIPLKGGSSPGQANISKAKRRKMVQDRRRELIARSEVNARKRELTKPDPVLGHQLNEKGEQYWQNSDLCKVTLSKDEVWGVGEDKRGNLIALSEQQREGETASTGPRRLNFGLDTEENRRLLFTDLPAVAIQDASRPLATAQSAQEMKNMASQVQEMEKLQLGNSDQLQRILDLCNASGKGIQVENIRRIREHFGTREGDERPGMDTGSVETQVAVLTYRIRNLHEHLAGARNDNHNRRGLTMLVHQRMRLLKYLKRKSLTRYNAILPRIGVEARAVEGEVIVPGKPMLNK